MKTKSFALFLLGMLVLSGMVFAQTDTLVVTDGGSSLPGWLQSAIAFVIALVPTGLWAKAKYRLGKFVALTGTLTKALDDNKVDNEEILQIRKDLKALVAKEEA